MINWLTIELLANTIISMAYLCIALLILVPTIRQHQFWSNKLATATAAIFFSCSGGHGLHALHAALNDGGGATGMAMGTWWLAVWHSITAVVAVYYLSLRQFYGGLLTAAPLFDDLVEQQRLRDLEAFQAEVTAREAAEVDRDFYAKMLKSINDNSQQLVYVKDLDGRYMMCNAAMEMALGVKEGELIGKTDDYVNPELAPLWRAADLKAQRGPYTVEEYNDTPQGRVYYDSTKFPLYDSEGEMYAVCGISLDSTMSKQATIELAKARDAALAATAAKSAFLATMSHEIRTPMNAVIGMTDLLLDTELNAQQREFLETVRSSGDALLAVINDILDFSKIEAGELRLVKTPFHLRDEVEGALDLVAAAAASKNLDLVCYVADGCPSWVLGDAHHLRQVLINLLSNAVKFTAEGDVLLTVDATPAEDGRHRVSLTVTDTGIGISPEGLAKMFRSFSQVDASASRAYGGTGLGLVISKRLAQAMGGDVEVTSVLGQGSTFTVTVLLDRCETPVVDEPTEPTQPELAGVSVLVVDDNQTNLRILDLQLRGMQMECTSVGTPEEALELVRDGLRYDVAVLDYNMPGMDGLQLAAQLRADPGPSAQAPMILLTSMGSRTPHDTSQCSTTLVKPVKLSTLRAAIASALQGTEAQDAARARVSAVGPTGRSLRILLAEDNVVNQRVAQLMLDKLGHEVETVDNGRAAVDAVLTVPYDVVLMDVQMPQMDGLEATRAIRARLPAEEQPHIVAMTASALLEDQQACTSAGMESYLTKPVRVKELAAMLTRISATIRPRPTPDGDQQESAPDDRRGRRAELPESSRPTPPVAPAIDPDLLERLGEDLGDTDHSMVGELIQKFLATGAATTATLREAASRGDSGEAYRQAHSMSASSALLGATPFADLLRQVQRVSVDDPEGLPAIAAEVQREYARVEASLRRFATLHKFSLDEVPTAEPTDEVPTAESTDEVPTAEPTDDPQPASADEITTVDGQVSPVDHGGSVRGEPDGDR